MDRNGHSITADTADFWSRRTGAEIPPEDARQAVVNIVGFFQLLDEWDQRTRENKTAN